MVIEKLIKALSAQVYWELLVSVAEVTIAQFKERPHCPFSQEVSTSALSWL